MQEPRPKTINSLAPGLLAESILTILLQLQDKTYDDPPPCPRCGSEMRTRHDRRKRIYATIITDEGFRNITVWIKRYVCKGKGRGKGKGKGKGCGKVYCSRSPFYPGCLYASPVVDTCLYLAAHNPFCRVEAILQSWGLQIDRDTIRSYVRRFGRRARNIAGVRIDNTSVAVNLVRLLFDATDVEELKARLPGEVFQDVGDETYPAIKGAKKRLREENLERALRGEKERPYPDSHTLACVYETLHKFFVSILVTPTAFNTMLADALERPAYGCVGSVRDGSKCYRGEHIDCVNHKPRRLIARDPVYRRLKKEAQSRAQIEEYCRLFYGRVREKEAERAAQMYPELVDGDGRFIGALSTNSMEGGNWRIKFGLKVPYLDPVSEEARTLLVALLDSMKTFDAGRPCESFAHLHGCFEYSSVMADKDNDRGPDTFPSRGGESDSSSDHTGEFGLWLNSAVLRAKQGREKALKALAATS